MYIEYRNNKIKKFCEKHKEAVNKYGTICADKLFQRMQEIKAADTLADLNYLPPTRCHQLSGRRKHQFAVDLVHPFRLILKVPVEVEDYLEGDEIKKDRVKRVIIWEVVDYHD